MKYFRLIIGLGSIALTACTRTIPTVSTPPIAPLPVATLPPPISPPSNIPNTTPIVPLPTVTTPAVAPLPLPNVAPANLPQIGDYQVIDELKQPQFMAQSQDILKAAKLPNRKVNFNPADLLVVVNSTRKYFKNSLDSDLDLQREGILGF